jgi:hypothetical protein
MENIWIIGAGNFGLKAVDVLHQLFPEVRLTLVDEKLAEGSADLSKVYDFVSDDGIGFLLDQLNRSELPDWIVPAIPVHVAYEWVVRSLKNSCSIKQTDVPKTIVELLPNPIFGSNGSVYISNVDFMCPEDCMEPESICTCTGKPRPRILHEFLSEINLYGFRSIVVHSRQLAPGVGGYAPSELFEILSLVRSSESPILLSTACKCHGVMNAFRIQVARSDLRPEK